jgi:hypothetical protein
MEIRTKVRPVTRGIEAKRKQSRSSMARTSVAELANPVK